GRSWWCRRPPTAWRGGWPGGCPRTTPCRGRGRAPAGAAPTRVRRRAVDTPRTADVQLALRPRRFLSYGNGMVGGPVPHAGDGAGDRGRCRTTPRRGATGRQPWPGDASLHEGPSYSTRITSSRRGPCTP